MKKNDRAHQDKKANTHGHKPKRRTIASIFGGGLALAFAGTALPADAQTRQASAIVMDGQTGEVLYSRNSETRVYPASTTKMMTAYLVFEALRDGRLTLDQNLSVSANAAGQPPTNLRMTTSQVRRAKSDGHILRDSAGRPLYRTTQNTARISVDNALRGMMTHSANDAAVVLGEALGGNRAGFAEMMNAKAQELGMTNTRFFNANGLHNANQYTTAHDMAILMQAIQRDFPDYYDTFFDIRNFSFNRMDYRNTNRLLDSDSVPGVDGGKTGYIRASGYNIVVSATRGDDRVITAVFGGSSGTSRNTQAANLTNFGFYRLTTEPTATFDVSRLYTPDDTTLTPENDIQLAETPNDAPTAQGSDDDSFEETDNPFDSNSTDELDIYDNIDRRMDFLGGTAPAGPAVSAAPAQGPTPPNRDQPPATQSLLPPQGSTRRSGPGGP